MRLKLCTKCKEFKTINCFSKRNDTKCGYKSWCKECIKIYDIEKKESIQKRKKEYGEKNRDKILEKAKLYYQENKDYIKNYQKQYSKENKELLYERHKKYREENKEIIRDRKREYNRNNRVKINTSRKNKRSTDPEFKLKFDISNLFRVQLKTHYSGKKHNFFSYTGIAMIEYVNSFKKDPLWTIYCSDENIHIDHIIPQSLYDFSDPDEIKKCWDPNNLRLLAAKENISKSDFFDLELIKYYGIENLIPKGRQNVRT